jgi:hypothetical protein
MRQIKIKKCRGCREAECIPSKARSDAAIQSEVKATQSEQAKESDKDEEKEREQRSRMYSVKDLLESRHSVGSECDTVGRDR